ncbi:unnamed protein product [Darwinula stevensoni]|uniref:Choline kinase n=1 Tax=Darwinula stevensoni TaxID=69355 RepID=A0A7R8X6G2_9CRUS|nr:unnamed protein product [Darwinula stevensoni]CAG0881238.1 unnamed protein product [Darwinula stevensoni]
MLSHVGRSRNLYCLVHKQLCSRLSTVRSFSALGIVTRKDHGGQRKRLRLMLGFVRRMQPNREEDSSQTVSISPCFPSTSPVFGYSSESAESDHTFPVNIQKLLEQTMKEEELRDVAYRICRDYLNGSWRKISAQQMGWKQITGGLSNILYLCSLPPSNPKSPVQEPRHALFRIYGQVHGECQMQIHNVITESIVFAVLSERAVGPRLYGVFPGGRLEEYIPARSLRREELQENKIMDAVARKCAYVHTLDVPIVKEPTWMWDTLSKWAHRLLKQSCVDLDMVIDFPAEVTWLRKFLVEVQSPVVFSHNDLQEGNLLALRDECGDISRIVLIDFEYCAYNYRAFDIANHFCEWMYCYQVQEPPYFTYNKNHFPSPEEQMHFIRKYLERYKRLLNSPGECLNEQDNDGTDTIDVTTREVLQVYEEVQRFTLASHLFWALWSAVNAPVSKILFGYWEYANARFKAYFEEKKKFLSSGLNSRAQV